MIEDIVATQAAQILLKKSDSTDNQLLSYWCKLFDKPLCSPRDFYDMVKKHLGDWDIPKLEGGLIELREGNVFNDKRLYLQLNRERLVCEVCAAPFGTGYFVSSRIFDRRRQATIIDYLVLLIAFGFGSTMSLMIFDWQFTATMLVVSVLCIWFFLKAAPEATASTMDRVFGNVPCLGPVLENFLYPLTYYRQDRNNMYQQAVHASVMATIEELNKKIGLKPLSSEEKKPTIRQLFGR